MPAVQAFSYYASAAIFVDFLLQITMFAAIMVFDGRRKDQNRIDCLPCIKVNITSTKEVRGKRQEVKK
jgi:Niemann-Pick C1 protein